MRPANDVSDAILFEYQVERKRANNFRIENVGRPGPRLRPRECISQSFSGLSHCLLPVLNQRLHRVRALVHMARNIVLTRQSKVETGQHVHAEPSNSHY